MPKLMSSQMGKVRVNRNSLKKKKSKYSKFKEKEIKENYAWKYKSYTREISNSFPSKTLSQATFSLTYLYNLKLQMKIRSNLTVENKKKLVLCSILVYLHFHRFKN